MNNSLKESVTMRSDPFNLCLLLQFVVVPTRLSVTGPRAKRMHCMPGCGGVGRVRWDEVGRGGHQTFVHVCNVGNIVRTS